MALDLRDKVVVITGASEGIGRETALLFAKEGASCALVARRGGLLTELLGDMAGGTKKHISCPADISNDGDVRQFVSSVMNRYGRIDILINNAAVSYIGRVKDMDLEKAENALNINLLGTIRVTRHVLPHMIKQCSGHIITISSIIGKRGVPYRSIYCVSKFGLEGFAESLRSEVDKYNIKVSVIRPPSVNTDFSNKIKRDSDVAHHALDSFKASDVAKVIVNTARRPRRDVNIGILAKGFLFLSGILPGLFDKIVREK